MRKIQGYLIYFIVRMKPYKRKENGYSRVFIYLCDYVYTYVVVCKCNARNCMHKSVGKILCIFPSRNLRTMEILPWSAFRGLKDKSVCKFVDTRGNLAEDRVILFLALKN